MEPRKQAICNALRAFIEQRPGFEFANYGSMSAYRSDQRRAQRQLHDARQMLRAVELADSISADDILREAQSWRLTIREVFFNEQPRGWRIDYCTGQYWPTEFRAGVCRLLSSVLWTWTREQCMPAPKSYRVEWQDGSKSPPLAPAEVDSYIEKRAGSDRGHAYKTPHYDYSGTMSAGDWLRAHFRQQFGKGMAARWLS